MPSVSSGTAPGSAAGEVLAGPAPPAHAAVPSRWWTVALAVVAAVGLALRLVWLWPPTQGVVQAPYDDEGVYVMAAQLLRQGQLPYRDFFFAHPPLGVALLTPAVSVAFTPWGSGLSFGLTRLLVVLMGTVTVVLVGLAAARLWGAPGGVIAAALLALDPASVAASRHILLETPMALLLAAALLAAVGTGERRFGPLLTGLLAGLAALVKVQALAFGLAYLVVLGIRRRPRALLLAGAGLAAAAAVIVPAMLAVGPGRFLRQVVLFQVARPGDGLFGLPERLTALLAPGGLLLGLVGAAGGLACAWRYGRPESLRRCLPVAIWTALGLAGFLVSRSFYPHYTSQVMPGLALLAGGLGTALLPAVRPARWRRPALAVLVLIGGGVAALGLAPVVTPRPDDIFARVARYVADATPPGKAALTTDAQFNYLASRPLPSAAGGYLVDSYGQLVYTGLGLDEGSLIEAARQALAVRAGATVHEVMWRPAAQALLRDHLRAAEVVVVHGVGRARLTAETQAWLNQEFRLAESTRRYDIYRRGP